MNNVWIVTVMEDGVVIHRYLVEAETKAAALEAISLIYFSPAYRGRKLYITRFEWEKICGMKTYQMFKGRRRLKWNSRYLMRK